MTASTMTLTLASTSAIRRQILTNAGVAFDAVGAQVDEDALKVGLRAEGFSPRDQADHLAEAKAVKVSRARSGLVLGCDQILALDGVALDKADTLEEAALRLRALRGKTHVLECAAVMARDGIPIWRLVKTARLTMRDFSDAFLNEYLHQYGQDALASVGCYQYEGAGAHLFSRVDGDYFAILGLPLLEVLDVLRNHGVVAS
jgi:septum formation protein